MKHSLCTISRRQGIVQTLDEVSPTDHSAKHSALRTVVVTFMMVLLWGGFSTNKAAAKGGELSSEAIRDTASRVMESHDYRGVRRRVLENVPAQDVSSGGFLTDSINSMGNAVGDFFEWLFRGLFSGTPNRRAARPAPAATPPSAGGGGLDFSLGSVFLYIGLAVLVGFAIWIIAAIVQKSDPNRMVDRSFLGEDEDITDLSTPPGELAASTYESRAMQMAADGNYKAAIRELLIGGMSWIERAGLIRFRKGLTNRDYVRAIWKQSEKRQAYVNTATEFERIYFGRRDANRDTFETCLRSFQGSFREEETPTTAV